jgi:hypothetical protein
MIELEDDSASVGRPVGEDRVAVDIGDLAKVVPVGTDRVDLGLVACEGAERDQPVVPGIGRGRLRHADENRESSSERRKNHSAAKTPEFWLSDGQRGTGMQAENDQLAHWILLSSVVCIRRPTLRMAGGWRNVTGNSLRSVPARRSRRRDSG